MQNVMSEIVWHVRSEKEYSKLVSRLNEYSINHKLDREQSMLPNHAAILVAPSHARRASNVIIRNFGRRSGVDLE